MRFVALLFTCLTLFACSNEMDSTPPAEPLDITHDYFSFANSEQFVTDHIQLDLAVDFELRELRGFVILHMRRLDPAADHIVLDTRDLHIDGVEVAALEGPGSSAGFAYTQSHPKLGQALDIKLPDGLEQQQDLLVTIHYRTDPTA
jgi:aminopeptidase N